MKRCPQCNTVKPPGDFHFAKREKNNLSWCCKACCSRISKEKYPSKIEKKAISARKYLYGLDEKDYQALLAYQNNVCAICKLPPDRKRLDVDHDHLSGKIRGLLCQRCNRGLGNFKDSSALLTAATKYAKRFE